MKFLANLRMKNKLALLLILPLAGLLYFSVSSIVERVKSSKEAEKLHTLTELAAGVDSVVHKLQLERGMSVLSIGDKGAKHTAELESLRSETDKAITGLKNLWGGINAGFLGTDFQRQLEDDLRGLDMLKTKRELVSLSKVQADEVIDFYSNTIASLLSAITIISNLSTNAELSKTISAYVNLVQAKELAGQERATLADVFSIDSFRLEMFRRFLSLVSGQNVYTKVFLSFATPEQKDFYAKKHAGQFVDEVSKMRATAMEKAQEGKFGVDPAYWFSMQTGRINILKEIEDALSHDMAMKTDQLKKEAQLSLTFFISLTASIVVVSLVWAYLVSLGITHPLANAVAVANQLAEGDVSVKVTAGGKDEAGQLLSAMENMVHSTKNNAASAAIIAAGNLSLKISPRSESDVLGNALADMVNNLRTQTRDIMEAVNVLATASNQIVATTSQLAAGTEQTAIAVTETTTTVEEVKQTATVSSQKAKHVSELAQNTVQASQSGTKLVSETIDGINRLREQMEYIAETIVSLSEHNQAIGEIIAAVDDLAEQSNLLAVNAAIEAAKAGEYGKGFVVVAQEIKSHAEQSKQATKQVRTILNDIQKASGAAVMATEKGSKAVEAIVKQSAGTGDSIHELSRCITEASQAVMQIAASSQQQLVGMDQVSLAMTNIKQATSQNATSTKQVETTVRNLQELGQKLKNIVDHYKV